MAGDTGAYEGNLSPFYEKHPNAPLYTIATGIGDTQQDSVLLVSLDSSDVSFEVISLTGKRFKALETYDSVYWETVAQEMPTD